jgi:hypothetical protein
MYQFFILIHILMLIYYIMENENNKSIININDIAVLLIIALVAYMITLYSRYSK